MNLATSFGKIRQPAAPLELICLSNWLMKSTRPSADRRTPLIGSNEACRLGATLVTVTLRRGSRRLLDGVARLVARVGTR